MFAQYKLYFIAASVAIALGTIGYLKFKNMNLETTILEQTHTIQRLTDRTHELEAVIVSKDTTIDSWKTVYVEQEKFRKDLQFELDKKTALIEGYKGRQHIVFAKPTLVERMEQTALNKFFEEVRDAK
ncbi:TMhelix containing protein [Vibrio phage 1.081.O._10N.286.52.C2]|nr:TMhelix containing protein [Vibrio phage 1.081.O._10N.286.52.C2]